MGRQNIFPGQKPPDLHFEDREAARAGKKEGKGEVKGGRDREEKVVCSSNFNLF
jgi:hypothetical protein